MKKYASTIMLVSMLVIGLSLILYPSVADWWNSLHQSRAIANYDAILVKMEEEDSSHLFDAALEYNYQMSQLNFPLMYYDQVPGYEDLLNVTGTGIMGYLDIPKIQVELPIYHGTSEGVLQIAVGHIQGSSLPTGGPGTHCVLSAHRGLPSARLFTDLDQLQVGDTFTLIVLDRSLTYEVDQVLTVLPHEVEPLYTVEGQDYCTLVTCTPYGVNSHRILVRGTRVESEIAAPVKRVMADAAIVEPLLVAPVVAAPILLLLLVLILIYKPRSGRRSDSL